MDKLHGEAPGLHHISRLVGHQLHLVRQPMLLQLQPDKTVGHGGGVDGTTHLLHAVGDGADVVLVAVGDEHTPQLLGVGHQIGEVGNHQIHAVHLLVREAQTAVHHNHVPAIL